MKILKLFFNRRKRKIEQLEQENESLKVQIIEMSFNFQQSNKKNQFLKSELDKVNEQNIKLANDLHYINMKLNNAENKNELKYY
jgi:hypothetical protein